MKDIIIEKKREKALVKFKDLFTSRKEIYANGSTDLPKTNYKINEVVSELHPKQMRVVVTKVVLENDRTKSFYLKRLDGKLPNFRAGSYITLQLEIDERIYKRPYSISSIPSDDEYRITIQKDSQGLISNYMFDHALEGMEFTILGPFGNFYYSSIRDSKNLIFLAGGSGITPIISIIKDLLVKKKVESIALLYGAKCLNDILFKEELDELLLKFDNFKLDYFLSEENVEGYKYGFIDESVLKEMDLSFKSIFVCGPTAMYESLNEVFKKLDIPNKYIRHEIYALRDSSHFRVEHTLTIKTQGKTIEIPCYENETLLTSMEKAKINVPTHCTVGVCGFCRSKLIQGEVRTEISGLRKKDIELKFIHPCVTYPVTDLTIELPF